MEAEALRPARGEPVRARRLEEMERPHDVRLDEGGRAVDGAVDMGFGGQMHDRVGVVRSENPVERVAVADIGMLEGIGRMGRDRGHVVGAGGIGQRVEVHDLVARGDCMAHDGRPDEPGAAGHEKSHPGSPQAKGVSISERGGAAASFSDRIASAPPFGQSIAISWSFQITAPSVSGA